ncbi:MAG: ATP-binding protein [Phycisphaerales bacterium]
MSENMPDRPIENLTIATVIEVDGTHVVAQLDSDLVELSRVYRGDLYPVGQFGSILKIHFGRRILYAYVARLRMKADFDRERGITDVANSDARIIEADLFGEAEWERIADANGETKWQMRFERGISTFPLPQQRVYLTPRSELRALYGQQEASALELGEHVGAGGAKCFVDVNAIACKHTAILGSTGSGKSAAVAALIHGIVGLKEASEQWSPRVVILDPHDEYSKAFPDCAKLATDDSSLSLPYWLLSLEETIALIIGRTEYAATSLTNILRNALIDARKGGAEALGLSPDGITADSPIPYLLGDPHGLDIFGKRDEVLEETGLVGAINAQRPEGKDKKNHGDYAKLIERLASLCKDSRLSFMMKPWDGSTDHFGSIAGQFLAGDKLVRIVDVSAVPNEVAGAASAAMARLLFSIKLWQTVEERAKSPVVLVCEEAHRYVPNRGDAQYSAAQDAIRRIAKEGRKYGVGLVLVSQRPSDVEPTVLSQCNSWIVLRITNEADRSHVRSVLPDSLAGLTSVLSGLRRREAIVVGLATALPSRVLIRELEPELLPQSHDIDFVAGWSNAPTTEDDLTKVAKRWRYQDRRAAE